MLNLLTQGSDFLWTGGPVAAPSVVLQPGKFALCLSRVNGEYDVLVTRRPDSLPVATTTTLGGIIAGSGTTVAADGTLSAAGTNIVNLASYAIVTLDLTPILKGAPEILFNLPIPVGMTVLSISHPPAAGTLAEFTPQVKNSASSVAHRAATQHHA
ncbi:hypothetical protein [Caballeronia glebae]|uniref:Uncharacterized protein n=1 Tax=Caballeronia glebae TaxID=1777143 RepID=A0A158BRY6_9BURK|nr:hypothetical protein [Caballeronia glebae]SAK72858.1 hypothetical protein AWB82_04476 [Caballeronia glebae]